METAIQLLGRKLCKTEKVMFALFGYDEKYQIYKDINGNLGFKLVGLKHGN